MGLLAKSNIMIKTEALQKVIHNRDARTSEYEFDGQDIVKKKKRDKLVVAPIDRLNEVVRKWNAFLEQIEKKVLTKGADRFGDQWLGNLDKFKKKEISLD